MGFLGTDIFLDIIELCPKGKAGGEAGSDKDRDKSAEYSHDDVPSVVRLDAEGSKKRPTTIKVGRKRSNTLFQEPGCPL